MVNKIGKRLFVISAFGGISLIATIIILATYGFVLPCVGVIFAYLIAMLGLSLHYYNVIEKQKITNNEMIV